MRVFFRSILSLTVLLFVVACVNSPAPSVVYPLGSLSDIDSLTVLIHLEQPCAGVGGETLRLEVGKALERAGIAASHRGPPYLHVRAYSRAGTSTVSDDETPEQLPGSWHFGMWIDNTLGYDNVSGPLTNICPQESALWWRGGTGSLADGLLLDSVRIWLSDFVADYRTTIASRTAR